MKPVKTACILLLATLLLAGCAGQPIASASSTGAGSSLSSQPGASTSAAPPESTPPKEDPPCYFTSMAKNSLAALGLKGDEDDFEKVRLAYRYIICRTTYIEFDQPELVENWRWFDRCGQAPSIYQVMAAGPLIYSFGTCENYSAALIVLLEHMGFEALYVPGLTWGIQGHLVDHAWVMVKIGDQWYHIDPQLEDNVIRGDQLAYTYFLKSDDYFAAHHVWGSHLPKPDPHSLTLPACPESATPPQGETVAQQPAPDVEELVRRAASNQAAAPNAPSALQPTGSLPPLPRFVEADPSLQASQPASAPAA